MSCFGITSPRAYVPKDPPTSTFHMPDPESFERPRRHSSRRLRTRDVKAASQTPEPAREDGRAVAFDADSRPVPKPAVSPLEMAKLFEAREANAQLLLPESLHGRTGHQTSPPSLRRSWRTDSSCTDNEANDEQVESVLANPKFLSSAAKFDRAKVFQVEMTDDKARKVITPMRKAPPKMAALSGVQGRVSDIDHSRTSPTAKSPSSEKEQMTSPTSIMQGRHTLRSEESMVKRVAGMMDDMDWDHHVEFKKLVESEVPKQLCPGADVCWPPRKCDLE